jgi:hypothetical protein
MSLCCDLKCGEYNCLTTTLVLSLKMGRYFDFLYLVELLNCLKPGTGYRLDGRGSNRGRGKGLYLFHNSASCPMGTMESLCGGGGVDDHTPSYSAEVKNSQE